MLATKSVADLAVAVRQHLIRKGASSPRVALLTRLFEIIYLASLKTEEGRPLQLRIALVDPSNPDPERPPAPRPSRWQIIELARLPLTVSNLAKLARAADPWSSCLAVYFNLDSEFFIWGVIDQTVHFSTLLVRERDAGYAQPGLFNVLTAGAADMTVYREHDFVARLAQDRLLLRQNNVFSSGPVARRIWPGVEKYLQAVLKPFPKGERGSYSLGFIAEQWVSTLCRILISIQRYRHGGALLITNSDSDLDIKYPLDYSRLPKALVNLSVSRMRAERAHREIMGVSFVKAQGQIATKGGHFYKKGLVSGNWYLEEAISEADAEDLQDEVTGCVRFISSLSCVDGLILAGPDLSVRGFGVEIRLKKEIKALYLASTPKIRSVQRIEPNYYGMRHRSMMRYCMAHPGIVGFVVSQDGEIRAITRVGKRLIMWENLQVHSLHEEVPRRKLSPKAFKRLQERVGGNGASRFTSNIPRIERTKLLSARGRVATR